MVDITSAIHSEIVDNGLENERPRLDNALTNHDFYRADFRLHDPRGPETTPEDYERAIKPRTAPVMRRIVEVLASHLYARGPARDLPDSDGAAQWLAELYGVAGVDGLLQEADRLASVADVAALECFDRGEDCDGSRVGVRVWPAHQFCVWEDPDDALRPVAVAVIDCFDQRRRLRLWTPAECRTYVTDRLRPGQTAGGTAYTLDAIEDNPFGFIPFAFIHYNRPTTSFWSGSPGDGLREMNDYVNFRLTDTGDNLRYAGKPITTIFGVGEGWRPPTPHRPGALWFPTAGGIDASGNGIPPSIESFTHDLAFVDASWSDLQSYIDLTLESNGVPQSVIRMIQASAASGVALVAEQLPLIDRAKGRQRPFDAYERELARVALAVGRVLDGRADLDPGLARGLVVRWPAIVPEAPATGAALDQQDDWALARGLKSRVQIAMHRLNISRDEALKHLADVALDVAAEAAIGLPPLVNILAPDKLGAGSTGTGTGNADE